MTNREVFQRMLPYYMRQANINQVELASAVGVTKSTVHYWLTGKSFPRIDVVQRIADRLGCRTDDLLSESRMPYQVPRKKLNSEIYQIVQQEFDYNRQMQEMWDNAPEWVKRVAVANMRALMNAARDMESVERYDPDE